MILLHDPKIQKIMMTVIVLASVLVIAGVELEPEDLELSQPPTEMLTMLILVAGLWVATCFAARNENMQNKEENEAVAC